PVADALRAFRPSTGTAPQEFVQRASVAAWADEEHVAAVRDLYRHKRETLLPVFERKGLRSAGGNASFFLWLAVEGASEDFARGEVGVAEPAGDDWVVHQEVQEAILDYFRSRQMEPREVGPFEYHDKIPLKTGYDELGVRVVPPAVARYGAYLSPGVVLMPSYVNIGAWVGPNTMVDTWATVGSGAQI